MNCCTRPKAVSASKVWEPRPALAPAWPFVLALAAAGAGLYDRSLAALPLPLRNPSRAVEYVSLDEEVRTTAGPILSENLSVLVLNHKPVLVEPFGLQNISGRGYWSAERVVADCRRGWFELIVYEYRLREIPGMAACVDERYVLTRPLGPYDIYRPR
jgi:hypothetical protein